MGDEAVVESAAPAPEAPAAEPIEAPVAESGVPASETVESGVPASETVESLVSESEAVESEPPDPFAEYGGKEEIERAIRLWRATQDDEGVFQVFFEAGQSLGLGLKEMQALFDAVAENQEPAAPEFDPDEPLTRGEFEALVQARQQEDLQRQAAQLRESVKQTVQAEVTALGLDPVDPSTKAILQYADGHLKGDFSADNVRKAIRQGHADYVAQVERDAQRLLQTKRQQGAAVPSAPSGVSAPSEPPPAEPKNVAEAAAAVRRKLGLSR